MNQWQTIDTCPHNDFAAVLLWRVGRGEPTIGYWDRTVWVNHSGVTMQYQPSHWMPLPDLPEKTT